MTKEELSEILAAHKKWLNDEDVGGKKANLSYANLRGAKLCNADLRIVDLYNADLGNADLGNADLFGANLDFSCFPLWCGGLDVHIDDRQAVQLLYHLVRNVLYSKNTSYEVKQLLGSEAIVGLANRFHRVDECGAIEPYKAAEKSEAEHSETRAHQSYTKDTA